MKKATISVLCFTILGISFVGLGKISGNSSKLYACNNSSSMEAHEKAFEEEYKRFIEREKQEREFIAEKHRRREEEQKKSVDLT